MSDDWKAKYEELVEKHSAVVDKRAKQEKQVQSSVSGAAIMTEAESHNGSEVTQSTAQDTCGNCGISPPCPGLCRLLSKDTTQDNSRWACGCGNVNSTKPRHPQYCSLCGRAQESSNEGEVK